jgi:hypothetical protein
VSCSINWYSCSSNRPLSRRLANSDCRCDCSSQAALLCEFTIGQRHCLRQSIDQTVPIEDVHRTCMLGTVLIQQLPCLASRLSRLFEQCRRWPQRHTSTVFRLPPNRISCAKNHFSIARYLRQ